MSERLFSAEDEQAIIARYQQGETGTAIARSLGGGRDVVYRILNRAGVVRPRPAKSDRKAAAGEKPAPERVPILCLCDGCGKEDLYSLPRGEFEVRCLYCGGVAWSDKVPEPVVIKRLGELVTRLEAELGQRARR